MSALLVSGFKETEVGPPSCGAPKCEGSCPGTLLSSSLQEELMLAVEFPLRAERCQLGDRRIQTKMKLFSSPLYAVILRGFSGFTMLLKFLK